MKQRILAIVSLLCGIALMALVVSIQLEPLAWTRAARPVLAASSTEAKSQPAAARLPTTSDLPHIVDLPAVHITSPAPTASPKKKREERALEPCSEWREVAPWYVENGKPEGARGVRDLCLMSSANAADAARG